MTLLYKLKYFLLDLHRFLAHQGSEKILDISTGVPVGKLLIFIQKSLAKERLDEQKKTCETLTHGVGTDFGALRSGICC